MPSRTESGASPAGTIYSPSSGNAIPSNPPSQPPAPRSAVTSALSARWSRPGERALATMGQRADRRVDARSRTVRSE
jgi:hypothetical protein